VGGHACNSHWLKPLDLINLIYEKEEDNRHKLFFSNTQTKEIKIKTSPLPLSFFTGGKGKKNPDAKYEI